MKKIFIIEDHEDMRLVLKRIISKLLKDAQVCGETDSGIAAIDMVPSLNPDIVLVDISLPGMDGLEVVKRLRDLHFSKKILVLTGHVIEMYQKDAESAGADSIVSKNDLQRIIDKIKQLLS